MLQPVHNILLIAIVMSMAACASGPETVRPVPEVPETRFEGVSTALLMGDPEKAIAAHEQAFKNAPQNAATKILHARLLLLTLRLAEAKAEIEAVLKSDPNNADALFAQALVAGLEGDRKSQKTLLERSVAIDGMNGEALAALGSLSLEDRDYAKAKEFFIRAQAKDGETLATAIGLGNVFYREKKYTDAGKQFDRAIALDPGYSFAYSDRALVKRQLGDADGALADLTTAIKLDPEYPYNYYDRGRIYMVHDKWDEAVAEFSTAIEKDPEMFIAYVMRGGLYDDMGEIDKAIADYEAVLRLRQDYRFAFSTLGSLYWLKAEMGKSADMFTRAFAAEKGVFEYALLAALAMKKAGKNKEAVDYLNQKIYLCPRDQWQYNMAQFLIAPEHDFAAVNDANREKKKAKRGQILFYLAEQYLLLDKKTLAHTFFNETAAIEPKGYLEKKLARYELGKLAAK
jgi:tetratricopeptide (TPR) repeat protein